jgi:hypothetical protein
MDRGKRSQKSSSKYWCVVPGCTSDSRKKTNLEKYPWMENNVTFIPFPTKLKNHRLRSKWIEMIRRPLCYQPLPRLILLDVPCNTTMSECLFPSENLWVLAPTWTSVVPLPFWTKDAYILVTWWWKSHDGVTWIPVSRNRRIEEDAILEK